MPSGVSYPSFKCILEYLEANKRIHICARSKALQKIDKKIPIHIKYLDFSEQCIYVNNTQIRLISDINSENEREEVYVDGAFRHWDQVIMPGDVCITDGEFLELSNTENLEIRNQIPFKIEFYENTIESRVPPDIPQQIAMKKAATVLFGGRYSILVSDLIVSDSIIRLPVGFNIRIRSSLDFAEYDLNEILPIIDPQSFPLKSIKFYKTTPEMYYHPIVQTAETLETLRDGSGHFELELPLRELLTFPHKHMNVIMKNHAYETMKDVVHDWLDHPREHGKTFTLWEQEGGMIKNLYRIKKQFNGKFVLIPGSNERVYPKAVIIPINSTSELLISIVEKRINCFGDEEIKLESVPTGTIQSTVRANLTYQDVLWSHWNSIQDCFEEDDRVAIFVSAGLVNFFAVIFYILYESYQNSYHNK